MPDEPRITSKKAAKLVAILAILNALSLPLVDVYFGKEYFDELSTKLFTYAGLYLFSFIFWFIGVKILHFDASGPIPFYASPVVWLTPLLLLAFYFMFFDPPL